MGEAQIVVIVIFIAHQNSTEVLQPSEQPLDFPAPLVAPQLPSVLRRRLLAVALVWGDHLNVERLQRRVQRIRVIRLITNQSFRLFIDEALDESFADKGDFMWRSRCRVDGDRKTSA